MSETEAETFMHACLRPMEAECFCVRKCGKNCQLNVAGFQRFLQQLFCSEAQQAAKRNGDSLKCLLGPLTNLTFKLDVKFVTKGNQCRIVVDKTVVADVVDVAKKFLPNNEKIEDWVISS